MIYGRHPVLDAVKGGTSIDKIYVQKGMRGDFELELRQKCREDNIPIQYVPKQRLSKITSGNHQGVIAMIAELEYQQLEHILPFLFEQSKNPLIVVLDGITDVRNFGAIARSCECLGAHALVVPSKNSAPVNAEAIKTSAGALTQIPVCREKSINDALVQLQLSGLSVVVGDLSADRALYDLDLTMPLAIVMGAEGKGVHPSVLKIADQKFVIPQQGQTDSLNVSVATGVILYEVVRQRK